MEAREELRTLPKDLAVKVARHLVMAGRLAEDEPEQSFRHAKAARRLASRVGIVREAAGIAAYHAGEWAEALAELRAARRLGAATTPTCPSWPTASAVSGGPSAPSTWSSRRRRRSWTRRGAWSCASWSRVCGATWARPTRPW
ncbi:hypothetical protein ACFQY7_08485 [Actinomadura luteofluorescens]|uniref:hypothetical protein n=1 Tax=Actinomadura luteofluorescens TaxID=46163 RepID=UPI00363493FB